MLSFILKHKKRIFVTVLLLSIFLTISVPFYIYLFSKGNIYPNLSDLPQQNVAIVFGAGINKNGVPSDMLVDRLKTAARVYKEGKVKKILVSGDNRFKDYDEPTAMYNKLVNDYQIPAEDVVRDYAGRRTYDTCQRAKEVFSIDSAILITQEYHLYRAIYTCESLGIKSYGYSATINRYIGDDIYSLREVLAQYKAVLDIILPPEVVKGTKEADL